MGEKTVEGEKGKIEKSTRNENDMLLEFQLKENAMKYLYWYLMYTFNFLMCMCVHMYMPLSTLIVHIHMYACAVYICVCLDLGRYVCLGWYACMYSYVDMYLHGYISVCMCIHTCVHAPFKFTLSWILVCPCWPQNTSIQGWVASHVGL